SAERSNDLAAIAFALPIRRGKSEVWRRFVQEMLGLRRAEYEEARRRLGIRHERAWLIEAPHGDPAFAGSGSGAGQALAFVYLEADDPTGALAQLAATDAPFDCRLRQQWREIHGPDPAQVLPGFPPELVYEWPGPMDTDL